MDLLGQVQTLLLDSKSAFSFGITNSDIRFWWYIGTGGTAVHELYDGTNWTTVNSMGTASKMGFRR